MKRTAATVTAATITDDQVRTLRAELLKESDNQMTNDTDSCSMALMKPEKFPDPELARTVRDIGREQCAVLWNARLKPRAQRRVRKKSSMSR